MKLKCLASGSSGNCHALISNDNEILLLDVGVGVKEIKRGIDYRISDVVGAVVSHGHLDHSRSVKDFKDMGIHVVKFYEIEDWDDEKMKYYCVRIGKFIIKPFPLPHNGTINYGFFIRTPDNQTILYMTDFEYCRYNFLKQKVNHILIECNYMKDLIDRDLPQYEHKIRGHCSLDYCKKFVEDNKTSALRTVLLLHMGAETCEPMECVKEVEKVANCPVYVARKGLEIELSEFPF